MRHPALSNIGMNVQSVNRDRSRAAGKRRSAARAPASRTPTTAEIAAVQAGNLVEEPTRRGRPLVDDKRRRILDAALRTFADRGFHGTVVPEVAKAAGVGTGTLYRYFEHKEALVNEVYRDAKLRLRSALLDGMAAPDSYKANDAERWFHELWRRFGAFARAEPDAFRFLEMQDHVAYLDGESRQLEMSVIAPLFIAGKRMREQSVGAPIEVLIALLWGAFVGVIKASRLGYLALDDKRLEQAGAACWRMIAPDVPRARSR